MMNTDNKWVGWTVDNTGAIYRPKVIWAYNRRGAMTRYGRTTQYINYKKRVVLPLQDFMTVTSAILAEIEANNQ